MPLDLSKSVILARFIRKNTIKQIENEVVNRVGKNCNLIGYMSRSKLCQKFMHFRRG